MKTVTAVDAKTHFSELLADASRGETIIVTRRGEPIAQIGPLREAQAKAREADAREAMRFLLSQKIKLGIPVRKAVEEGRRR